MRGQARLLPTSMFHSTTRDLPTIQSMLSPESLPLTPVSTELIPQPIHPFNFTMLDLELLHYYVLEGAVSYLDKSELAETFRTTVIEIAFEHAFLMHELLSLSALSLAHRRPEKRDLYLHASDTHLANALASFQPEIANLTEKNCHACFVFSTAFLTHAWVSQDLEKPSNLFFRPLIGDNESMHVHWVTLHRGTNAIMHRFFALLCSGPLRILISPFQDLKKDRADPVSEEEELRLSYLIEAWRTSDRLSEEEKSILDKAVLAVRRVYSMLAYYPDVSKHAVVMNWFAIISDEYLQMVRRIRAMVSLDDQLC